MSMHMAPTGDRIEVRGVAIVTLADGLGRHVRQYGDSVTLQRQIGSLPEPGSRGEKVMAGLQALGARRRRRRNTAT